MQRRRELYQSHHLTEQPIPVFVGPLANPQASYVDINTTFYKLETPLKSVDTAFKICHAINAKYPIEAEIPWLFLQRYIYNITTIHDKHFVSANALIADIEKFLAPE